MGLQLPWPPKAGKASLAGWPKQNDFVAFIRRAADLHSWGTNRHTGHCQASCGRTFDEKAFDCGSRHMTLENVTIDFCRVARCQTVRNTQTGLQQCQIVVFDDLGLKLSGPNMLDPSGAAPTIRIFVNDHDRWSARSLR